MDGTPDYRFKENREDNIEEEHTSSSKNKSSHGSAQKNKSSHGSGQKSRSGQSTPRKNKTMGSMASGSRTRPPTPYALYVKDNASKMHKEEGMDMNEVFRELGDKWRSMDEDEKNQYYDQYNELKMEWEESGHKYRTREAALNYNSSYGSSKKAKSQTNANQDTDDESVEA